MLQHSKELSNYKIINEIHIQYNYVPKANRMYCSTYILYILYEHVHTITHQDSNEGRTLLTFKYKTLQIKHH